MSRFAQLLGIANNLADSFVSLTNSDFLREIAFHAGNKELSIEIELLQETVKDIKPEALSEGIRKGVKRYKEGFLSEIENIGIELKDIEKVSVKLSQSGKSFKSYSCSVTIRAKGKEYTKSVSSYYA